MSCIFSNGGILNSVPASQNFRDQFFDRSRSRSCCQVWRQVR